MNYDNIIEPAELDIWIEQKKAIQVIDISEDNLLQILGLQAVWIPAPKLIIEIAKIEKDIPVILCCHQGNDSFMLMNILSTQYNYTNVYSLKSGIYGWKSIRKK